MLTPAKLIEIIRREARKVLQEESQKTRQIKVQYAKVDPAYTSGRPYLIFDGETSISGKKYPYLASYTPAADDRVQVIDGVIQNKIV